MKKIIYTLSILTIAIAVFACTTTNSTWTREQRATIHRALQQYRDMVYLEELTDAEFYIFSDNATDVIEESYPNFTEIMEMPLFADSIGVIVNTIIVEQLDADGANIRHIYPYRELKKEQRLPRKLSRKEQRSFYKCLARKINAEYSDFGAFFNAVLADTTDTSQIATFEAECAKSLFDWDGASATECTTDCEPKENSKSDPKSTSKRKKW